MLLENFEKRYKIEYDKWVGENAQLKTKLSDLENQRLPEKDADKAIVVMDSNKELGEQARTKSSRMCAWGKGLNADFHDPWQFTQR